MSVNYAAELSHYPNKGVCGLPELHDSPQSLASATRDLADLLLASRHTVVHTGAGISTAAGIPDFRGPRGVWTLQARGEAPPVVDVTFDEAAPTFTHRAILALYNAGHVKCVVTQNIDGLHMRSGLPSCALAELHGNMFVEMCDTCGSEYARATVVPTIGQKYTGAKCTATKASGRMCRGRLKDSVLDWEHELPARHIELADEHCRKAHLSLTLGTSLRIEPANKLPLQALKNDDGRLVIVNLQETKMVRAPDYQGWSQDKRASLVIHARVDEVMRRVCELLDVSVPSGDHSESQPDNQAAPNDEATSS